MCCKIEVVNHTVGPEEQSVQYTDKLQLDTRFTDLGQKHCLFGHNGSIQKPLGQKATFPVSIKSQES